jgi:dTDP-4-amino-4,6-dideoxygalactose transaminase
MSRDALYERLKQWNVHTRRYFYPVVCDYACYRNVSVKDPLSVARRAADRILTLPIYDGLELSDVEAICEIIMSLQLGKDTAATDYSFHDRRTIYQEDLMAQEVIK